MKRRSFIKKGSAASIPLVFGGLKVSALDNPFFNSLNGEEDKVLVLIQLSGGNDGLNTIVPLDQYDNLAVVRENIVLPENKILGLTDTLGLHPAMGELKNVFDNGQLGIVQSVAYPNQNRSHFRSSDIWHSGSGAEEVWTTGWLGRYFDLLAPGYPSGYPNGAFPDPLAITIGSNVSETCEGSQGNFSLALSNPDNLTTLAAPINGSLPDTCFGDKMEFLATTIVQTNAYNSVVETANDQGSNLSTKYDPDQDLAAQLKLVARLISGGLRTKIYVVQLGGFDTHGDQVDIDDTTIGNHAELLSSLSGAIAAFQDDLQLLGLDQRVIGMTYSEFGRRIRSNASNGTDHGTAAPLMLFGSCVNPGVMGDNPEVSLDVEEQEGVSMQFDFRSIYASLLVDWFGVEESTVRDLLYEDFQYIPILRFCGSTSNNDILTEESINLEVFPNPFDTAVTVRFTAPNGFAKLSIFDVVGHELKVLTSRKFSAGTHTLSVDTSELTPGTYYYRMQTDLSHQVKRVVKVR